MITPQTDFRLYKGIGWNNDYRHTLWFKTLGSQIAYMEEKKVFQFDDFLYVRQSGAVRVGGAADMYYDCNYCSFLNMGHGQKRFYAFVTGVEYINDDTTLIYFEVDIIQTWLFELEIGRCFVEREHVSNDTIGLHTVPENIPFGDMVTLSSAQYSYKPAVIVKYAGDEYKGDIINNIYDPLVTEDDPDAISSLLHELEETPEKVAMIKMGAQPSTNNFGIARTASLFSFNGDTYTPVNKKLFCYPYTAVTIDDFGGNQQLYKWEDFADPTSVEFEIRSETRPIPFISATPKNYKNNTTATMYMVVKTDFPDCPYVIDNFRAWLTSVGAKQSIGYQAMVQQQTVTSIGEIVGMFNAGISGVTKAVGTLAVGGVPSVDASAVTGSVGSRLLNARSREIQRESTQKGMSVDYSYAETHGTSIGGQFGGNIVPWAMGLIGWRLQSTAIKPEYARIIDDFFTRFGYKVDRYKVPNLFSRTRFNFIKTSDANIGGNVPSYVSTAVSAIFDRGITIWHTGDIGNYSIVNPTTGKEGADG